MTASEISRHGTIRGFHQSLLRGFRDGSIGRAQLCGWSGIQSQEARFAALLRNLRYEGGSVVDYGCGTGDLFEYVVRRFGDVDYTGLDQDASMIALAEERYGAHFRKVDLDEVTFEEADYVVASGVFQFRDWDNPAYFATISGALFAKARVGFAANFLSSLRAESEKIESELYLDPAQVTGLAVSLSPFWVVDHAYHPGFGDVTLAAFQTRGKPQWSRPKENRVLPR